MADAAKPAAPAASADHAPEGGGGGGSNKMMLGVMALNMVMMAAVAVVLFLGQKKQAAQETLDQVEQGAAAAGHGAAAGGHGAPAADAGGGHGAPAADHGAGGEAAPAEGARFFSVGDFIANLAGPASTHYVKVTVNFELNKEADDEELKQRKPQFRDKVISLLNSKQPSDLQSVEGRNALKEEIKTVSNTFLKKGKVEGVYFSAFVVN